MIEIQLKQNTVSVGDKLSGRVIRQSDRGQNPMEIKMSIGWYTEGRGEPDRETVSEVSLDSNTMGALPEVEIPFSFTIPYEGPISYEGDLIRVLWRVEVWASNSGITEQGKLTCPFQVIPRQPA